VSSEDLHEVVRREQLLLDPAVRADRSAVLALLHPDFVEFGKSGRVWDRDRIVAMTAADPSPSGPASDFESVQLADDVVLLTFRVRGDVEALRSSVWVRDPSAGWQMRFCQGTRIPPEIA